MEDKTHDVSLIAEYGLDWNLTSAMDIQLAGQRAYIATGATGLAVVDVSDPGALRRIPLNRTIGEYVSVIEVKDNWLYAGCSSNGLQIFNLANPDSPVLAARLSQLQGIQRLRLWGDYLYCLINSDVHVINVRNPAKPFSVSIFRTPSFIGDIALNDSIAFIATADSGIRIYDIDDPIHPTEIGTFTDSDLAQFCLRDTILYAAYENIRKRGLELLNVSTPSSLVSTGKCLYEYPGVEIVVRGDFAFLATTSTLVVFDISNPSAPHEVGLFQCNKRSILGGDSFLGYSLDVCDGIVFMAGRRSNGHSTWGALFILDVSQITGVGDVGYL